MSRVRFLIGRLLKAIWHLFPEQLRTAASRFERDHMMDRAAGLTFYLLMSFFPGLLIGAGLLGLVGEADTVNRFAGYLTDNGAPRETVDAVRRTLDSAVNARGTAGGALALGFVLALYGASGAFGAAGRALNAIAGIADDRGFVQRKLVAFAVTLGVIALATLAIALLFVGGQLTEDVFQEFGLGATAADAWNALRWPLAVVVAALMYSLIYRFAPDPSARPHHWLSPGSAVCVAIWIAASALFYVYVTNIASYSAIYGVFAGFVVLLFWLWLTNLALLFGAELNAVLEGRDRLPMTGVEASDD
jgi:membrane protein